MSIDCAALLDCGALLSLLENDDLAPIVALAPGPFPESPPPIPAETILIGMTRGFFVSFCGIPPDIAAGVPVASLVEAQLLGVGADCVDGVSLTRCGVTRTGIVIVTRFSLITIPLFAMWIMVRVTGSLACGDDIVSAVGILC